MSFRAHEYQGLRRDLQIPAKVFWEPNMRRKSQKERTLRMLQDAGNLGIHSFHFYSEEVRIFRVSQRIRELQAEGYTITHTPERMGSAIGTRYTLVSGPQQAKKIVGYHFDNENNVAIPIYQ